MGSVEPDRVKQAIKMNDGHFKKTQHSLSSLKHSSILEKRIEKEGMGKECKKKKKERDTWWKKTEKTRNEEIKAALGCAFRLTGQSQGQAKPSLLPHFTCLAHSFHCCDLASNVCIFVIVT